MSEKKKVTAAEFAKLIQDQLDPMHERGTIKVTAGPKRDDPLLVTTGGTADPEYMDAAHRKAGELSILYEISANQSS